MSTAQNHQEIPPSNVKRLSIRTPTLYLTMSCITARETRHTKASTGRRLSLLPLGRHRRSFQPLTRTKKPSHPHHFHRNQSTNAQIIRTRPTQEATFTRAASSAATNRAQKWTLIQRSQSKTQQTITPNRDANQKHKRTNERTNGSRLRRRIRSSAGADGTSRNEKTFRRSAGDRPAKQAKRIEGRRTFANGFLC